MLIDLQFSNLVKKIVITHLKNYRVPSNTFTSIKPSLTSRSMHSMKLFDYLQSFIANLKFDSKVDQNISRKAVKTTNIDINQYAGNET